MVDANQSDVEDHGIRARDVITVNHCLIAENF